MTRRAQPLPYSRHRTQRLPGCLRSCENDLLIELELHRVTPGRVEAQRDGLELEPPYDTRRQTGLVDLPEDLAETSPFSARHGDHCETRDRRQARRQNGLSQNCYG